MNITSSRYKPFSILILVLLGLALSSCSANRGNVNSSYQSTMVSHDAKKFNGNKQPAEKFTNFPK